MTSSPPHRPFQFRLADLLLFVLLDGVLCTFILAHFYAKHKIVDPGLPYPSVGIEQFPLTAKIIIFGSLGVFSAITIVVWAGHHFQWRRGIQIVLACLFGLSLGAISPSISKLTEASLPNSDVHIPPEYPVISECKAYGRAQFYYYQKDFRNGDIFEYAGSVNGKFGLAVKAMGNKEFAAATVESDMPLKPFCGYIFKILKSQGVHAKGGRRSYLTFDAAKKAHLTHGHALVAAPAVYGGDFRHTFIINQDEIIDSCDFGSKTPDIFNAMTEFDPDPAVWQVAE